MDSHGPSVFQGLTTVQTEGTNGHDSNHRDHAIYLENATTIEINKRVGGLLSSSGKETFSLMKICSLLLWDCRGHCINRSTVTG